MLRRRTSAETTNPHWGPLHVSSHGPIPSADNRSLRIYRLSIYYIKPCMLLIHHWDATRESPCLFPRSKPTKMEKMLCVPYSEDQPPAICLSIRLHQPPGTVWKDISLIWAFVHTRQNARRLVDVLSYPLGLISLDTDLGVVSHWEGPPEGGGDCWHQRSLIDSIDWFIYFPVLTRARLFYSALLTKAFANDHVTGD